MTDELKHCPCGAEAQIVNVTMLGCSYVICTDCRMQSDGGNILGIDRAVAAWNTRADLATPLDYPRVKALVEAANGVVNEYYNQVHGPVIYNIKNLDAALSALEENQ